MADGTTARHRPGSQQVRETGTEGSSARQNRVITQELVDQIADRVYALLLRDLKTEQERCRLPFQRPQIDRGGW
jgi:hypothetical protein